MKIFLLRVGLGFLGVAALVLLLSTGANAQAVNPTSSWQNQEIHLVSSSEVPYISAYDQVATCNGGKLGTVRLKQEASTVYSACVFGEVGDVRIARFYHPQWFTTYAVSFKSDIDFYRIEGICGGMSGCSYAAKTDTFLAQAYVGSWQKIAGIHRDFTKNLHRNVDLFNRVTSYSFSQDNRATYFEVGTMPLSIEAAAFSQNGEWLALEVRSMGILRVHVSSLDMRRVSAPGSDYGLGSDPSVQLAVSNDGSTLAITGRRMGLEVIGIDSTCGDRLSEGAGKYFASSVVRCQPALIDYYSHFRAFYFAGYPSFSGDGKRLSLMATSLYGDYTRAVLSPERFNLQGKYGHIGLGDSYSSGEGETSNIEYLPFTDSPPHRCHVSRRSYPLLLSGLWSVDGANVACSGATTADIYGGKNYKGQGNRIAELSESQQKAIQIEALTSIRQGILHQTDFVEKYQPDIVTLGIGGNDIGFIDKLKSCLGLGTCEWAKDLARRMAAGREIQSVFSKIQASVKKIKEVSPHTKVILVGYPEIINPTVQCGGLVGTMFDEEERVFMREAIRLLNMVVADVAAAEGEYFADVQDAYGNNSLCNDEPIAMNAVRTGNDIAPISSLPSITVFGSESFHPTPYGHTLVARRIADQFPDAPFMLQCNCSSGGVQSALTSYWIDESVNDSELRRLIRQDIVASTYRPGDTIDVRISAGIMEPGSSVRIEVHSEPTVLGEATVDATGALSAQVTLPAGIPDGFHTIHVIGTDRSLQTVEVYQLIAVSDEPIPTPGSGGAAPPATSAPQPLEVAPAVSVPNSGGVTSSLGAPQPQRGLVKGEQAADETARILGVSGSPVITSSNTTVGESSLVKPAQSLGALVTQKQPKNIAGLLIAAGIITCLVLVGWLTWMKVTRSRQH